ncbi:MAG TPA: DUF1934 domain-containing protein [Clostridiaceae bacterium]|nr:DUF1934 domain-containing protein [Clostridiaceae bacterium]
MIKVNIRISSNFQERPDAISSGTFEMKDGQHILQWFQLPEKDEPFGAQYILTYKIGSGILDISRTGNVVSKMRFCSGARTRGELATPEGCFELEIYTHLLVVPDGPNDEAHLVYDLTFLGQEPMRNELRIFLTKNDDEN